MSAYFKRMDAKGPGVWYATTCAGSFLACIRRPEDGGGGWVVETDTTANAVVQFATPNMELAFDFVVDQLAGMVAVK